jgi:hypothetical protein
MRFPGAPLVLALTLSLGATACHSTKEPNDAQTLAADIARTETKLAGSWRLIRYDSAVPLDGLLGSLLQLEMTHMTIRFEGGRVRADGAAIHLDRRAEIRDAAGPRFHLVVTDEAGVSHESVGMFSQDGNWIAFEATTSPWRGRGVLQRAAP